MPRRFGRGKDIGTETISKRTTAFRKRSPDKCAKRGSEFEGVVSSTTQAKEYMFGQEML
jgi:hypothetical protein